MAYDAPPRWDRRMQQRLARGEAAALGELYDRFAALVHSQAHRMLDDDDAADLVTREVFAHVWENPEAYDPRLGSMRSWVARLAHHRSVARLRSAEAAARTAGPDTADGDAGLTRTDLAGPGRADSDRADPGVAAAGTGAPASAELEERLRRATAAARADYIAATMPEPLRAALELAYIQRRDYRQTAADLGVTEIEARRRLRLGLQLLSTANLAPVDGYSPPGYGRAL